ncbi:MAG: cob(I)yrinic acid a,c-diamide adenosyltransferase [Prevotella sp.]|nr:cob(I)yrinic acid a,c-diamide adenosyltransferase [Alistipes senegalensis]MCM1358365.1 cob(I)yrinic acid a,c-diamide adenosyltransferase [Prevotella sp.]MCM1474065.1 cob(I)yrinic acid a,c-diamide adenosyltransferase [Muribaculaceae bacterium]
MRFILHIYHGNGKGKTTAAVGLAIRAAGAGLNVMFMQFLKNGNSSENEILKQIKNINICCCDVCNKFTFRMNDTEKKFVTEKHNDMINRAFRSYADIIILDEFLDAYNKNMIDRKISGNMILSDQREIILTGRNPAEIFLEKADYISEINAIRHPYEKGITARKGIEY